MNRFDICYIISHGFAARMVIETNLLGELVKKGKTVAVITPDVQDFVLVNYCNQNKIKLFGFNAINNKWSNDYSRKRKYLFENIYKNPALLEKHIYDIKFSKTRNPIKRLKPFYWILLQKIIHIFPVLKKRYFIQETKLINSSIAKNILKKISPRKLVATYPVNLAESQLLFAANKINNIETWIHLLSWDNITSKGRFPALADKYIAWGPIMENELMDFYNIKKENIFKCGVPHFDLHYSIKKKKDKSILKVVGLKSNFPTIFFGMSSPRFAPYEIDIVENLAQRIENNGFEENLQLIIRPHPQNVKGNMADLSWLPRLKKINDYQKVYVDFPNLVDSNLSWSMGENDMTRLSSLISVSFVVLNSGSTISIDALYLDKPVIMTSFDGNKKLNYWQSAKRLLDYTHLKKLISYGGISVARSQKEMEGLINKYLENSNYNYNQRYKSLKKELFDVDGNATNNVVNTLINN